jgi:hypothetical protein
MSKTIAQQIKWDFTNGNLEIKDKIGNLFYFEDSNGYWEKWERDSEGKPIYFEDSNGHWEKWEYDSKLNQIYWENSKGEIIDHRPKSCDGMIVEIEGEKYKLTKV